MDQRKERGGEKEREKGEEGKDERREEVLLQDTVVLAGRIPDTSSCFSTLALFFFSKSFRYGHHGKP